MSSSSSNIVPVEELEEKYRTESRTEKMIRKTKEAPFMPIGIAGALLGVAYGALKFKNRGATKTSMYLIHLRVAAQGTVVTALTCGVLYSMFKDYIVTSPPDVEKNSQQ